MGEVGVQWNALMSELGMACPDGTMPIVSSTWACIAALHYVGKDAGIYLGTESEPIFPKGCYEFLFTENLAFVFMNEHETGALESQSRNFCHQNLEPLPPGEVVFLGDSDIDFWTTSTDIVPRSLNVGIGGHLCSEVLQDIDSLLEEAKPSTVVLACGRYDLAQNTTVADTFDLFSNIVDKISDAGSHVLYLGTKPEPANQDLHELYQDYDKLVNDLAISLAEDVADPPLTFIDVYSAFVDLGNPFDLYQGGDQESLALYGYELWSNWTVAALEDTDEVPCVVWKSGECVVRSTFSGTASPIAATTTAEPSPSPSENPTGSPSGSPSATGITVTSDPTASPSGSPTAAGITVTSDPTASPSGSPTATGITVTSDPTASPSGSPTATGINVTSDPTASPSGSPSAAGITVTSDPTASPSGSPTATGITVTSDPTASPSGSPSATGITVTSDPTASPSGSPTATGITITSDPTASPSGFPTVTGITVTSDPTASPSGSPTATGITVTSDPTASPSGAPIGASLPSPAPSVRVVSTTAPISQPVNSPVTENPSRAPVSGTEMPIGCVTFVPIIAMALVAHLMF